MAFAGTRVFISRKYFAPEVIDSLHDVLKQNRAEVCLCSNPDCNSTTDFHVLPSFEHEKFEEFRGKGCNVIGPECIIRCAKEHRTFPKQGYTCCLAMEGVKVLTTGFERQEKLEIERLVAAMCGETHTKVSMDITFVIARNVLAAKYKWSLKILRRPILTINWLYQCFHEHRLVPYEPYRLLPFTGLTICSTNFPFDARNEIAEICTKNGGIHSADLTMKCTHLIAYLPEGDKYKVAKKWGHIKIVSCQWLVQCVAAKACVDEDLYPIHVGVTEGIRHISGSQSSLERPSLNSQLPGSAPTSSIQSIACDTSLCEGQTIGSATELNKVDLSIQEEQSVHDWSRPDESGGHGDDMYLADCRIYLAGFTAAELRKLVNMVREGGGTRHIEFNEKVTHVIVGRPTESELKDIRQWAMWGAIQVLHPSWLEECTQQGKEVIASNRHLVPDRILLKGWSVNDIHKCESSGKPYGTQLVPQSQISVSENVGLDPTRSQSLQMTNIIPKVLEGKYPNNGLFEKPPKALSSPRPEEKLQVDKGEAQGGTGRSGTESIKLTDQARSKDLQSDISMSVHGNDLTGSSQVVETRNIFKGSVFGFSASFPMDRREEIIHWVLQGEGTMEAGSVENLANKTDERDKRKLNFLVESHGVKPDLSPYVANTKPVSSHWIRYCLEEGRMLSPESHVLYQPLPCQIPLRGFESLRFCVSQYEEQERLLLRNLCYVLGSKFTEKLNKKVTHLLCKVEAGQKYVAAQNWGIEVITAEWLYACISENTRVPLDRFHPREISVVEQDAGLFMMTQYPSQAAHLASGELPSQWETGTQVLEKTQTHLTQNDFQGNKWSRKSRLSGRVKPKVGSSNAHLTEKNGKRQIVSLSQGAVSAFDPWDEQTFRWSDETQSQVGEGANVKTMCAQKQEVPKRITRAQQKVQCELVAGSPLCVDEGRDHDTAELNTVRQPLASTFRCNVETQVGGFVDDEKCQGYDPSSDVAAAIEGLLAQTSKINCSDNLGSTEADRELLSPEHATIRRKRDDESSRSNLKRSRQWQSRDRENSGESKTSGSLDRDANVLFDESQMDSQVGYDEDHTGKQMIMERMRTRSMPTNSSIDVQCSDKAMAWKSNDLGRLFKAAEANK